MRLILALLAGLSLALSIAPAAWAQQKLVLISWGGPYGDAMKQVWFEPFERETGIKVELRTQGSMMDELAKLRAQRNRLDADLWITGMSPTQLADESGLLHKIPADKLKNAADLPKALVGDSYVGVWTIFYGIAYNRQKVPFEIKSWNDLFDPRLKGRISVPHGTGYGGKFITLLGWLGGGGEANIEPAFAKLAELRPNVALISKSDPEAIKFLTSGEVDVATMMPPGNFVQIREAGPHFAFVAPPPFVPTNFNNFALLKGPNPEAAIRFIDFALGVKPQEDLAERIAVIPANTKAAVPTQLRDLAPARELLRYPDEAVITRELPKWADRWNREVQAR